MGCDIHMHAEKWDDNACEWVWLKPPLTKERYYERGPFMRLEYFWRNYDLFAILADVRNDRGFGGHVTGTGFEPISEPKGLPEDCSPYVKRQAEKWNCDGHSHSWLMLSEVLSDQPIWNLTTKHIHIIGIAEYRECFMSPEIEKIMSVICCEEIMLNN